ncbi:hypothetical protein KAT51_06405 [bacterium]|nr:hypothetical protein [bacterium]
MIDRVKRYCKCNLIFLILFFIFAVYFLRLVFLPFLQDGFPLTWDHADHIMTAHFFKAHLCPWQAKWNNLFYAGFPQDTLYPPLIHYLNGLLGSIFGVFNVYMALCCLSVLLLPWAFYWFTLGLGFRRLEAALATFLPIVVISTTNLPTGITLFALFTGGLFINSGAFLLLLFYLGFLVRCTSRNNRYFALTTIFLAGVILSHLVVALVALILSFILVLFKPRLGPREKVLFLVKHYGLCFLLSSFWSLPFLIYSSYMSPTSVTTKLAFSLKLSFFVLIALGALLVLVEEDRKYFPLLAMASFFLLFSYADFLEWGIPMHTYRLLIYALLFGSILGAKLIFNKQGKVLKSLFGLIFIAGLTVEIFIDPAPFGVKVYRAKDEYAYFKYHKPYRFEPGQKSKYNIEVIKALTLKKDGRLITFTGDVTPFVHDLRALVALNTGIEQMLGLFLESSLNSRMLTILYYNLTNTIGFIWGVPPELPRRALLLRKEAISKILTSFNINYILSAYPLVAPTEDRIVLIGRPPIEEDRDAYYLYKIGDSHLVDLLYEAPEPVYEDWPLVLSDWLILGKNKNFVYRPKNREALDSIASREDRVAILASNNGYLKMKVDAQGAVPLYIKISYFPRWKAYVNGEKAEVYRVSPNLMLVYGRGIVELKYQRTLVDHIGSLLTIIGLVFLIMLMKRKQKR